MGMNISKEALELMRQFLRELAAEQKRHHEMLLALLDALPKPTLPGEKDV